MTSGTSLTPTRVQLSRAKGWRKPDRTIVVARPSRWGNPFKIGEEIVHDPAWYFKGIWIGSRNLYRNGTVEDAQHAVWLFEYHILGQGEPTRTEIQEALAGYNLACWCKPDSACHADVLLRLANS